MIGDELQRQLAASNAERDEALARERALSEVLEIINCSSDNLGPVWDAMLERATRLCDAASGIFWTYDGTRFYAAALYGVSAEAADELRKNTDSRPSESLAAIAEGEAVVRDDDFTTHRRPNWAFDTAGMRTGFIVAMRKGSELWGAIRIFRRQAQPFGDKQIALVRSFAAQAVIAMENARLLTETREALEQQTATAEVLQVINSSPGNLKPVFEAMLEKATRLCDAPCAILWLYEGSSFRPAAVRGLPQAFADYLDGRTEQPLLSLGAITRGEPYIHSLDLSATEIYRRGDYPLNRAVVDLGGARTGLLVPLSKDETLIGAIRIYRKEVRPFFDTQIALLQSFAAQAVIAMENARLLTETREALEQQTATAEVLQVINSSPGDLEPVFDAMLEKAMRLCHASGGAFRSYDGDLFHAAATRGVPAEFAEATQILRASPLTALGRIERGERMIHIPDIAALADIDTPGSHRRDMLELGNIRTALWVALRSDDKLLGSFVLYRSEVRPFIDKEIALVESFSAQAVIAMENARLLAELRQRTEEVAELNHGLEARVAEQVDELGRVGRLKRFLAPQLAELIVSQGDEKILDPHRREIVVVFCDLRGYTAFTETAEPEEVLDFLREYHGALGPLVAQFEGTLDQFSGDGIMVFFNDPLPIADPAERAISMAIAMREAAAGLISGLRRRGGELGFGVGIAQGYATLGRIGFAERSGYTAIGTVCNVASRLCGEAKDGQILLSQRVAAGLESKFVLEEVGPLRLKGLTRPILAFNTIGDKKSASDEKARNSRPRSRRLKLIQ